MSYTYQSLVKMYVRNTGIIKVGSQAIDINLTFTESVDVPATSKSLAEGGTETVAVTQTDS